MLPKIAIITPTWERHALLRQTLRYVRSQCVEAQLAWFVLDDGSTALESNWADAVPGRKDLRVLYRWSPKRMTLGRKRNVLNTAALAWGADVICAMDDDDWYGPDYVADMAALLAQPGVELAGSADDYYYDVASGAVLLVPGVRRLGTCNGVLCYRASVLQSARYDDNSTFAEEAAFLRRREVAQHPCVRRVHLALAHARNTVSKANYPRLAQYHTSLSLADFPMEPGDRDFYAAMTAAWAGEGGA